MTKLNGIPDKSGCLKKWEVDDCGTQKFQDGDDIAVCCCDTPKCNGPEFIFQCAPGVRIQPSCGGLIDVMMVAVSLLICCLGFHWQYNTQLSFIYFLISILSLSRTLERLNCSLFVASKEKLVNNDIILCIKIICSFFTLYL